MKKLLLALIVIAALSIPTMVFADNGVRPVLPYENQIVP